MCEHDNLRIIYYAVDPTTELFIKNVLGNGNLRYNTTHLVREW